MNTPGNRSLRENPWLQPLRAADSPGTTAPGQRDRLVCWPPAGGSAGLFHPFADALPEFDVWSVQPPGRATRSAETPVTEPEEAIGEVLTALDELPPTEGRLVVLGHSMGAAAAHLLAARSGTPVDLLVLSAWPGPTRLAEHPSGKPATELDVRDLVDFLRSLQTPGVAELDDAELAEYVVPQLRADLVLADALAAGLAQVRARAPALLALAEQDPAFSPEDILAWRDVLHVRNHISFSGGHFALFDNAGVVAEGIEGALAGSEPRGPAARGVKGAPTCG